MRKLVLAAVAACAATGMAAANAATVHFQFEGNGGASVYDAPTGVEGVDYAKNCGTFNRDFCSVKDGAGVWGGLSYAKDGIGFTATAYKNGVSTLLIQDIYPINSGLGALSEFNNDDDQTQFDSGESIGFVFSQIVSLSNIEFRAGDDTLCSTFGPEGPCGWFNLYIDGEAVAAHTLEAIDLLAKSFVGTSFLFVPITPGAGFAIAAFDVQAVPIPGALPLLISGLAGLGLASRRRKKTV